MTIGARAVCVPSGRVSLAYSRLEETAVKVIGLSGFPLGNQDADVKRFEAEVAVDNGAHEVEMTLNHTALKEGRSAFLLRELRDVVEALDERPLIVAAEFPRLSESDIVQLCHICLDAGVVGISTGTGFWPQTRPGDALVKLAREATSPKFLIKIAPVTTEAQAAQMVGAGANRLGITFEGEFRQVS